MEWNAQRHRPRIGISMRALPADPGGLGAARAAGWWLHRSLATACAAHGAEAWPLPPLEIGSAGDDARSRIAFLDALILGGGGDLAVDAQGLCAAPGELPLRDRYEYALLDAALARGIPVLGICRGAQLLQLAAGGALLAPAEAADTRTLHCDRRMYLEHLHPIELRSGGLLSGSNATVNSAHRWTIRQLAPGLRTEAICPIDGTVEAFSSAEQRLLGTLWHPEFDLDDRQVFGAFLALMHSPGTAGAGR